MSSCCKHRYVVTNYNGDPVCGNCHQILRERIVDAKKATLSGANPKENLLLIPPSPTTNADVR